MSACGFGVFWQSDNTDGYTVILFYDLDNHVHNSFNTEKRGSRYHPQLLFSVSTDLHIPPLLLLHSIPISILRLLRCLSKSIILWWSFRYFFLAGVLLC